jgi:hypothetical protein
MLRRGTETKRRREGYFADQRRECPWAALPALNDVGDGRHLQQLVLRDRLPLIYVNKAAGAALVALLDSLDAQYCDAVLRSGCALPQGVHGCPAIVSPSCVNGLCARRIADFPDAATN